MDAKRKVMEETPIGKLLFKFSLPAMLGMMVHALYHIADTIFVGRWVGTEAIAALAVSFPIMMLTGSVGILLGIGGASVISRRFGEHNLKEAEDALGNMLLPGMGAAILLTAFFGYYADGVLRLFGASEALLPMAEDYFYFLLPSFIFMVFKMMVNNAMRAEGNPKYAMFVMIFGAVLNIILDPIFIYVLDMGVKGAAIASSIAHFVSAIFAFYYFASGRSLLKLKPANFRFRFRLFKEMAVVGSADFFASMVMSVMQGVLNQSALKYGGEVAIAFMGIFLRIYGLFMMSLRGIAQGLLPIAGFSYGARQIKRTKEVIVKSMVYGSLFVGIGVFLFMVFPGEIISIFSKDERLIDLARSAARILVSANILVPVFVMGTASYQALGKGGTALFLNMLRQVILFIPLAIVLPRFLGLKGLWLTFPISDIISFVVCLFFIIREFRILNRLEISYRLTDEKEGAPIFKTSLYLDT